MVEQSKQREGRGDLGISLFGCFQLSLGGVQLAVRSPTQKKLIALLSLQPDSSPLLRRRVISALWPDTLETRAMQNLRTMLYRLRKEQPDCAAHIEIERSTLAWREGADVVIDTRRFSSLLEQSAQLEGSAEERWLLMHRAAELYRAELLPEWSDEWLATPRRQFAAAYEGLLDGLFALGLQLGEVDQALTFGSALLRLSPHREELLLQMMQCMLMQGKPARALALFEEHRATLREELDAEPHPETAALAAELRATTAGGAEVALPAAQPEWVASETRPIEHFVGRERELLELSQLLLRPECRLLTLHGPGGVGKTQLARKIAQRKPRCFLGGITFLSLEHQEAQSGHLYALLADRWRFSLDATPTAELLASHLRPVEQLLILDNFEQLLDWTPQLLALLDQAPQLKVMLTSRQRLGVAREWVYPLEGLARRSHSQEDSALPEAVALFFTCAQRHLGHLAPTPQLLERAHEICEALGGLPLGIELAASWLRLLSPGELLDKLRDQRDAFDAPSGDFPPRQQSLQAVFDGSFSALSEELQGCLSRLSIFQTSFTHQAASQVVGCSVHQLAQLMDHSLLSKTEHRFSLHPSTRRYAAQQLELRAKERAWCMQQLVSFTQAFLTVQGQRLEGPTQREALEAIGREEDTLLFACEWAAQRGEAALLGLAADVWSHSLSIQRRFSFALDLLGRWEALWSSRCPRGDEALRTLALLRARRGHLLLQSARSTPEDEELWLQALPVFERLGLTEERARCLCDLGLYYLYLGELTKAESALQESIALSPPLATRCSIQHRMGLLFLYQHEYEASRRHFEASLADAVQLETLSRRYAILENIGIIELYEGRLRDAEQYLREALHLMCEAEDEWCIAGCLLNLAETLHKQGESERGMAMLHQALEQAERVHNERAVLCAHLELGFALLEQGRWLQAKLHLEESLSRAYTSQKLNIFHVTLVGLAAVAQQQADSSRARTLLHFVEDKPLVKPEAVQLRRELSLALPQGGCFDTSSPDALLRRCFPHLMAPR